MSSCSFSNVLAAGAFSELLSQSAYPCMGRKKTDKVSIFFFILKSSHSCFPTSVPAVVLVMPSLLFNESGQKEACGPRAGGGQFPCHLEMVFLSQDHVGYSEAMECGQVEFLEGGPGSTSAVALRSQEQGRWGAGHGRVSTCSSTREE
jgi:hypothetical protein